MGGTMIWNTLSPFYDFFETLYNGKVFKGIAKEIKNYVNADDVVLECACGTGLLSVPIAEKCKSLVATDFSDGMIKRAEKKLRGFSNVELRKMNMLEIPYSDNSFDVVVAANVIHLLDAPEKAMRELLRVCKKGGKMVIPTYINRQRKNAMLAAGLLEKMGVDFKRQFNLDSYKDFFSSMGLENVQYKTVDGRMPCVFAIIENV